MRTYISGRAVPIRIPVKLDAIKAASIRKGLDSLVRQHGLNELLTVAQRYVKEHRDQLKLESEIASRERELESLRRATAAKAARARKVGSA
jgi:hypothetical protein